MISNNDLYDLSAVLTMIRNDVQHEMNAIVLSRILQILKSPIMPCTENQIRYNIRTVCDIDVERWKFAYVDNHYTYCKILKNNLLYQVLIKICRELKWLLGENKYSQAYDLVDATHCLPIIIADNSFSIPRSYWKSYMRVYRQKWDKHFLLVEEKRIRLSNLLPRQGDG